MPRGSGRRLLVTGAGGFVGRYLMATLVQSLRPGDRLAGIGRTLLTSASGAEVHRIDLLDALSLHNFIQAFAPTHIVHLAAMSSVSEAVNSPAQTWKNNVISLINLCEAVGAAANDARLIYVSSGEVYGRAFLTGTAINETVEPLPANPYARSKRAGELVVEDVLKVVGTRYVILRPFNQIGPGQDERFVVASFAGQIARIEAGLVPPVLKVGDLAAQRDFLDVADVVEAYRAVIEADSMLPPNALFNVASGITCSVGDILRELQLQATVPFEIQIDPERMRPSEIPIAAASTTALVNAVGWRPSISLRASLSRILESARALVRPGG